MELKEYLLNTVELSVEETAKFDELFAIKEIENEDTSLVFFYSKLNPIADFNIFIKHKNNEQFNDTLEGASLGKIVEFIQAADMGKVVEVMQILTLNPAMLTKIKTTIAALNEKTNLSAQEVKAARHKKGLDTLCNILNKRLDETIAGVSVDVVSLDGKELEASIIEEVKLLVSILPIDPKGYSAVVGHLFENIDMAMNFPTVSEVENSDLQYDSIFGMADGDIYRSFGAVVSLIPKSSPEKAMLFNRTFSNVKETAREALSSQLHFNPSIPATLALNKVMESLYRNFSNNFVATNDKEKIEHVFSLSDLDKLQEFFTMKNNHYTSDVKAISQWMRAQCEKLQLSYCIVNGEAANSLGIKDTLKI